MSRCVAVVLSYNRPQFLRNCLAGVEAQTLPPTETLVVDNGSDEPLADIVSGDFPNVSYLRLRQNGGTAAGFGAGIEEGVRRGAEWLWIMDDDAEPDRDCLRVLVEATRTMPDAALVAPLVLGRDRRIQEVHRGFYSPMRHLQIPVRNPTSGILPIGYCSYLGPLLRAAIARVVEPPLREFFMYGDDVEYSMRIGERGPMYLVPGARMFHRNETTNWRSPDFPAPHFYKMYYGVRNKFLILRRHEHSRWRRAVGYAFSVYRTSRAALSILLSRPPGTLTRLRFLARGLADGFRARTGKVIEPHV